MDQRYLEVICRREGLGRLSSRDLPRRDPLHSLPLALQWLTLASIHRTVEKRSSRKLSARGRALAAYALPPERAHILLAPR